MRVRLIAVAVLAPLAVSGASMCSPRVVSGIDGLRGRVSPTRRPSSGATLAAPYEQEWRETGAEQGEFLVLTDPGTGRGVRSLVYPIGEWEEEFKGSSELFGAEPGVVYRNTTYNEIPHLGPVHLTESATPLGWETTQRTLSKDGNEMVVDRSFTPRMPDGSAGEKISSKEYFTRVMVFRPLDAS